MLHLLLMNDGGVGTATCQKKEDGGQHPRANGVQRPPRGNLSRGLAAPMTGEEAATTACQKDEGEDGCRRPRTNAVSWHPQYPIPPTSLAPPSRIGFVVVSGAADTVARVECEEGDTVQELRRLCHVAAGVAPCPTSYLQLEDTKKPLRDAALVRHYGLVGSQRRRRRRLRLQLMTGLDGCRLRGGMRKKPPQPPGRCVCACACGCALVFV